MLTFFFKKTEGKEKYIHFSFTITPYHRHLVSRWCTCSFFWSWTSRILFSFCTCLFIKFICFVFLCFQLEQAPLRMKSACFGSGCDPVNVRAPSAAGSIKWTATSSWPRTWDSRLTVPTAGTLSGRIKTFILWHFILHSLVHSAVTLTIQYKIVDFFVSFLNFQGCLGKTGLPVSG